MSVLKKLTQGQKEYSRSMKSDGELSINPLQEILSGVANICNLVWESKYQLIVLGLGMYIILGIVPTFSALMVIILFAVSVIGVFIVGYWYPRHLLVYIVFVVGFFGPMLM